MVPLLCFNTKKKYYVPFLTRSWESYFFFCGFPLLLDATLLTNLHLAFNYYVF